MDKKFYVMPEIEAIEIETQGMLAASLGGDSDENTLGGGDSESVGDDFNPDNY